MGASYHGPRSSLETLGSRRGMVPRGMAPSAPAGSAIDRGARCVAGARARRRTLATGILRCTATRGMNPAHELTTSSRTRAPELARPPLRDARRRGDVRSVPARRARRPGATHRGCSACDGAAARGPRAAHGRPLRRGRRVRRVGVRLRVPLRTDRPDAHAELPVLPERARAVRRPSRGVRCRPPVHLRGRREHAGVRVRRRLQLRRVRLWVPVLSAQRARALPVVPERAACLRVAHRSLRARPLRAAVIRDTSAERSLAPSAG